MLAVCRKELKLYFGSFFSYTVICLTLLLFGILSYCRQPHKEHRAESWTLPLP